MPIKLRIIVVGLIVLYSTVDESWNNLQFPLGLHLMGYDVYYIEDTMAYPCFHHSDKDWGVDDWSDATECITYLQQTMIDFGLADRWAYRDVATGKCFGLSHSRVLELCKSA